MRIKGKITSWNDEKGFGFVEPCLGGERVFFHISALSRRTRRPEVGQLVTYTLSAEKQGRPCVAQAVLAGDRFSKKVKSKNNPIAVMVVIAFFIVVGISVVTANIPPLILALYFFASVLTFIMYAIDKSAAQRGAWRTQESTLHLFSLIGGWPGALIAQQKLRHKSRKKSFRFVFWVTVCLNCAAFIWLFTSTGSSMLHSLIDAIV